MNTNDEIRSLWKAIADLNLRLSGARGSAVSTFIGLTDTPSPYVANKIVKSNAVPDALVFGADIEDLDNVDSLVGQAGKYARIKAADAGIEYAVVAGGGYGKDIVDEDFEGLAIGNINGQGSYGVYAGTWSVVAAAGTTCEVIAGKMLRLHDASAANEARCRLDLSAGYECPCGLLEYDIRTNVKVAASRGVCGMAISTAPGSWIGFYFNGVNQMRFRTPDANIDIGAYAVDTWYNVKIYIDTMAQYACLWLDDVYKGRNGFGVAGVEIINRVLCYTKDTHSGQDLDIDNLKFTHLAVPG